MLTVFVALVLAVLTFAFITYPFFRRRLQPVGSVGDENLQELQSRRDTTYSMLKEPEFDYKSGILAEEDLQDLETRYKKKAISILRDIGGSEKDNDSDMEEEIEKQIRELRQSKGRACPKCGVTLQEDDRFCSQCGAGLIQGEAS